MTERGEMAEHSRQGARVTPFADQNEKDYIAFAAAVDSGRLTARTGV